MRKEPPLCWRLRRLLARYGGRLSVHGFVEDMGSWLRAADVVATKAGPATIAESACCGTAMALTGYLPGQERGNVDYVTGAGAGMYWPSVSRLIRGLAWLRATWKPDLDARLGRASCQAICGAQDCCPDR